MIQEKQEIVQLKRIPGHRAAYRHEERVILAPWASVAVGIASIIMVVAGIGMCVFALAQLVVAILAVVGILFIPVATLAFGAFLVHLGMKIVEWSK